MIAAVIGILAALLAIVGIKWRSATREGRAKDETAKANGAAADSKLDATEARAESRHHAGVVEKANESIDAIDRANTDLERRARILEEHANVPKIDPADPRPGAARLRQVPAGTEAVPGVHRDPGKGD